MTPTAVLYIDDEPDLLELGKIFLEATGNFTVTTTESAEEGLRIIKAGSFDLILSDYSMPELDGIALLKAIRSQGITTPFILFTGRGREEVAIEALNNGADFYIQKGGEVKAQFTELAHKISHAVMRRRAERALAESRDYLDQIFSSVKAGIMVIDAETHTIIDVNPTAASLIGLPPGEIIGKVCHRYVCPAEAGKCPITDIGMTVDNSEKILITAKGSTVPIIKYVTSLRLAGRQCLLETFIDNSERKRAEDELRQAYDELKQSEAKAAAAYAELAANEQVLISEYNDLLTSRRELKENEERYRLLFDSAGDAILIVDNGIVTDCNPRTLAVFGCANTSEIVGHPVSDFSPEFQPDGRRSSELIQEIDLQVLHGKPMMFSWLHVRRDGTPFWASVSLNCLKIGEKILIQSIIRDITESRRSEEAMLLAGRKVQMLDKVTRFEIRNIVTGLVGMVDLAQAATSDQERDKLFRQKKDLIAALLRQIEFTEQYQEIGTAHPRWQKILPLVRVFSSISVISGPELDDLEIYADPLLAKVFLALEENVIRHGRHATEIRIHASAGPSGLVLVFEDNGRGIPEGKKTSIFEHRHGDREAISLFLVREILGITGITITENGRPGNGARFELKVPPGEYRHAPE